MKTAFFSTQNYEKPFILQANQKGHNHNLEFFENTLSEKTAILAKDFPVVCCFVTDKLSAPVLSVLSKNGTKLIALRSAGFNHIDLDAAKSLGLTVVRVPEYSPYSVAEFAVGLIIALNRKIHKAYQLVKEHNFLLTHLLGFDLHNKTVGIIGAGKIGTVFAKIMNGFGCKILAYDPQPNETCKNLGVQYTSLEMLCQHSDIIGLHCPLNKETHYIINDKIISNMKQGVMLINTGRGGLIDTKAIINALKNGTIGYLGLDVYEEEENLFFRDLSENIISDDVFARLQTFPNVIITGHQAFFTKEALINIAATTMQNITDFEKGQPQNLVKEI